jgi:hypothetical protein
VTKSVLFGACAVTLALSGCVATHRESAALSMPWPLPPPAGISAAAPPRGEYPTVGGDVLKGTSLADLAAARAAATTAVPPSAPAQPDKP